MWPYRRGYAGRNYHVTGGHEREAKAAEMAKQPNPIGLLVLRLLGLRVPKRRPALSRRSAPSHEHRHKA